MIPCSPARVKVFKEKLQELEWYNYGKNTAQNGLIKLQSVFESVTFLQADLKISGVFKMPEYLENNEKKLHTFSIIYLLVVSVPYEYFASCEKWNLHLENLKHKLKISPGLVSSPF